MSPTSYPIRSTKLTVVNWAIISLVAQSHLITPDTWPWAGRYKDLREDTQRISDPSLEHPNGRCFS